MYLGLEPKQEYIAAPLIWRHTAYNVQVIETKIEVIQSITTEKDKSNQCYPAHAPILRSVPGRCSPDAGAVDPAAVEGGGGVGGGGHAQGTLDGVGLVWTEQALVEQ